MNVQPKLPTAIVIGAGPAGLACALGLSKVCQKVHLVEKHASFEKRGATFGMAQNGQLALEEIYPDLMVHMRDIGMKPGFSESLVFVWWEMRDAILKFVKQRDNITLHCGEEFMEIMDDNVNNNNNDNGDDDNGVIKVSFQSGLHLVADFVVGADGVHSRVRNVLGLAPPIKSETTLFRGSLQVPDTASIELKGCLEGGMVPLAVDEKGKLYFVLFNFHERHPGRLAWILSTSIDVRSDDRMAPFALVQDHAKEEKDVRLIKEVLALSDEDHLKPYPKSSIVDLSDAAVDAFVDGGWGGRGRITLTGDAAHGMPPTDGYGGSMAMEDALVLTRIFETTNNNNAVTNISIEDRLRKFELERFARVKKVYDNQCERYNTRMREGKRPGRQSKEFMDWLLAGV